MLNLLLNLPLLILGVMKLGKRFISYTILSVAVLSVSLYIIPIHKATQEPILASLFGGVIVGFAMGMIFRAAGSSGALILLLCYLVANAIFHSVR